MDHRSRNRRLLDLPLPVQSVHITTNVVSSQNEHGEVYVAAGRCFSLDTLVSSTNKADRHDINEILLKVALNTKTLTCCRLLFLCLDDLMFIRVVINVIVDHYCLNVRFLFLCIVCTVY